MSSSGYFVLGGGRGVLPLPTFTDVGEIGNLIGSRDRGHYALDTTLFKAEPVFIPTRDKTVRFWANADYHAQMKSTLSVLDSDMIGHNYVEKLRLANTAPELIIVNTTQDTHGSLALAFSRPLYVHGLMDTMLGNAYILWSTDPIRVSKVLGAHPLRFLVYRFPVTNQVCLFFQAEAICSKWFRWIKTSGSALQAFNALEHRLYGPP